MWALKLLNKILGAILYLALTAPWIILATAASVFLFLDDFPRIKINRLLLAPFVPIFEILAGLRLCLTIGWYKGIYNLTASAPTRIWHFFTKQIFFGLKDEESVRGLFKDPTSPHGIDKAIPPGFFGSIVIKFNSLMLPIEIYNSYASKNARAISDVNIYFTEQVLGALKQKYDDTFTPHTTLNEIITFLENKKLDINHQLAALQPAPEAAAKIKTMQFELAQVKAALRCVQRLRDTNETTPAVKADISTPSVKALCYVWQAIETEGYPSSKEGLKDKLIMTLYQIQRGFNIVNGSGGADLPECAIGSLGLLMRVVTNEPERIVGNPYQAADPSPANLTEALKATLDRPFATSSADIQRSLTAQEIARNYSRNPAKYKREQKKYIRAYWKIEYRELIQNRVLDEKAMDDIVNAGVEAWEPPALQMRR